MKKLSIKDIAKKVGVSPSTVSFVLNGKAREMRISEEMSDKILKAAEKWSYQPNQFAVGLRTGQSKIIGLIIEDISNSFFSMLAKVIEDKAKEVGYRVIFCSTENDNNKAKELIRILSSQQADGYLITPTKGLEDEIQALIDNNKAVVLMDRFFFKLNAPYVVINNYESVVQGMNYLLGKGYKKIGFVTVDIDLVQMNERIKGYKDALKKSANGNTCILKLKYNCKRQEAIELILSFLNKNPDLNAVFFATNYLGIYGLESIKILKLKIPEDIAILCFDDHDIFRLHQPTITAIEQPIEQMGTMAIQLLMDQLDKKKDIQMQVRLDAHLIARESS